MKHQRSKRHQHMSDKVYKSSLIDADELVNYEDDAEMLDDVANFSGESEGQIEYLKYEEFEDPNQNHSVEQENADEIPPTMNEFSEITEVNADYCDFTIMLEQLYGESYNSFDVALHSYDGTVRAHRSVLAACSEFFRVLFKSSIHFEIEPIINIYLPDYSSSTIQLLIKFLYSGQIVLPPELVNEFADICHELNVNTINSNFNSSTTTREHQDYVQIVEDLSNKLNCKRVLPQAEQLPIEVPDSDSSSDFVDLDDNYLAYKRFCKKKLKKKKGKTLDNRMDLALIEVLAGEEPLAAAKKFQITTNDLIDYVSRYKNIQQMTNNIPTVTIPTVYKIKRAQEGDLVSNDEELYEVQKPWDFQNSNRPSSSGLATVLVNNAAENQIRHPKTLTLQIFNK